MIDERGASSEFVEDRGHVRIHCRDCGYVGWSEDTGACPRCEPTVPDAEVTP